MNLITYGNTTVQATNSELEFLIRPEDLVFDIVETSQRSMGSAHLHEARIDHEFLGELIWHVWEYPAGIVETTDIRIGFHDLLEEPSFSFSEQGGGLGPSSAAGNMSAGEHFVGEGHADSGYAENELSGEKEEAAIEEMTNWFGALFEDPALETPYNGREGGFQFIWGGPYDADTEIQEKFSDKYSYELIHRAVEEVESDGVHEWAPSDAHPDMERRRDEYFAERQPRFGTTEELDIRNKMLLELDQIAAAIPKLERPNSTLGGNNPPPEARFWEAEIAEIEAQIQEIGAAEQSMRSLLAAETPDVGEVVEQVDRFERARAYIAVKLDKGTDAFVTSFGKSMAVTLAGGLSTLLGVLALKIPAIQGLVAPWLSALGVG